MISLDLAVMTLRRGKSLRVSVKRISGTYTMWPRYGYGLFEVVCKVLQTLIST
jgi:hypothetical protein